MFLPDPFKPALFADEGLRLRCEGMPVALADDPAKPVWIQIAKTGSFKGHSQGEFAITTQTFAEIIRNFKSTENRRVPIDFEHASEQPASEGAIPMLGAPAQGWIIDLKIDGDRLMGLVEWMQLARDYIKEGKYRFLSPAIRFGARDRETGKPIGAKLSSAALTNQPFLDGMMPLAAKDTPELKATLETSQSFVLADMLKSLVHRDVLPRIRYALRINDLTTPTEMMAQCGRLREMCKMADANGQAQGIDLHEYMRPLGEAMRMPIGSTWGDVLDAVEGLIKAEIAKHNLERHHGARMKETNMETDAQKLAKAESRIAELEKSIKTVEGERDAAREELTTMTDAHDAIFESHAARFGWTEKEKEKHGVPALLLSEIEKRDDVDAKAAVEDAFAIHCKGKDEKMKEGMVKLFKSDRALFEQTYPKVAADKKHLLTRVAPVVKDERRASVDDKPRTISMRQLAHSIAREQKIPLAEAQVIASQRIRDMRKAGG